MPRPGVSVVTDKAEITVVSLIMAGARLNDSGSYLCQPFSRNVTEELPVANISVHVIKGANIDQLSGVNGLETLFRPLLLLTIGISGMGPTNIFKAIAILLMTRLQRGETACDVIRI